jgi:hypothetical protein
MHKRSGPCPKHVIERQATNSDLLPDLHFGEGISFWAPLTKVFFAYKFQFSTSQFKRKEKAAAMFFLLAV